MKNRAVAACVVLDGRECPLVLLGGGPNLLVVVVLLVTTIFDELMGVHRSAELILISCAIPSSSPLHLQARRSTS